MTEMESSSKPRSSTREAHRLAVEKTIRLMRSNLADWDADLSLGALAREGCYSKSHLIGIFEQITGTTPHHFLACLRIEKAKHLLTHTTASSTEIGLEVGYQSFSTFTRTFTAYVGMSPSRFRAKPGCLLDLVKLRASALAFIARNRLCRSEQSFEGRIGLPHPARGLIFVGTFLRGVPLGRPESGTVLLGPGKFRIRRPANPGFHLLAALVPFDQMARASNLFAPALVVRSKVPESGDAAGELMLRPSRITDPPLVVSPFALLK